jgi:tetratricopeptide (TPR) repeat protein
LPHVLLGWAMSWRHEIGAAIREFELALSLNPNSWDWRYANVLNYAGQAERALDAMRSHQRLDPFHPPHVFAYQGHSHFILGRYAEAVEPLRKSIQRGPRMVLAHIWLAAVLVLLGKRSEASDLIVEVRSMVPRMTLARWHAPTLYVDRQHSEIMIGALREAGFE